MKYLILFLICITDVNYLKYVNNYSYFVVLEGDICFECALFNEYVAFVNVGLMFWLPW